MTIRENQRQMLPKIIEIITLQQIVKEQEQTIKVILKQNHELQKSNERLKQELVKSGEAVLKKQTTNVTYSENRKSDTQSKNSRSLSEVSDIPTVSSNNKPTIVIAGDSIIKDIKGWLMTRNKRVKISSFPGANTEDMKDFLTPLLRKNLTSSSFILALTTHRKNPRIRLQVILLGLLNE